MQTGAFVSVAHDKSSNLRKLARQVVNERLLMDGNDLVGRLETVPDAQQRRHGDMISSNIYKC